MASPYIELEVGERTVKVTNPDKVYFPEIGATKRELVEYYVSVGEGALRALKDRPTNLKRHPDGVQSEAIYQKRMPAKRPDWLETVTVTFPSGRKADALRVTEVAAIAYCANLATIDFHPWQVRARRRRPSRRAAHRPRPAARRWSSTRRAGRRSWRGRCSASSA